MKVLAAMFVVFACCYCLETEEKATEVLVEDSRAKKKKNNLRMLAMIALFVFSKMAVFKVVSFMMLMSFFQKLFTLVGAFLGFYMNKKSPPSSTYGPPVDYNTVGYSYGPPDTDKTFPLPGPAGQDYGLPSLTDIGGSFNSWLFNKNNY